MVSASLVKDPQVIYWNKEPLFDGPLVPLPEGLGDVHIVYSKLFPKMINPAKAQGKRETGQGSRQIRSYEHFGWTRFRLN